MLLKYSFPKAAGLPITSIDMSYAVGQNTTVLKQLRKYRGHYEDEVLAIFLTAFSHKPSGLFINVGSNIGYFPIQIGKVLDKAIFSLCFEASPELVEISSCGVEANELSDATQIEELAISDKEGILNFYLSAKSDASNSLNPDFRIAKDVISVRADSLDNLLIGEGSKRLQNTRLDEALGSKCIGLLVDTETTEPDVLKGAEVFIKTHSPLIVCEVLASSDADGTRVINNLMRDLGYFTYSFKGKSLSLEPEIASTAANDSRNWVLSPNRLDKAFIQRFTEIRKGIFAEPI